MSKFLKKKNQRGIIHILSTQNNTIISLTDLAGNVKIGLSTGVLGFKNSRKSTTYAAQAIAEEIAEKALHLGFSSSIIKIKGLGFGKDSCIRALYKSQLIITQIIEQTPVAHNGCRAPKKRRI